jgi:cytochrome c-type biogenesis protein CcmH
MNFWILAITLLVVPAAIVSWPLLAGSAKDKITALFIVLMIPLAGILMYQTVGTPEAINLQAVTPQQAAQQQPQGDAHSSQQGQMDELVTSLQQRMAENPDDPEGWLILGRSLKTMQRYSEAETALANANRLSPDNPMIMVELAEASLFASGKPQISPEARQLIEAALAIDPEMQKGLWLMGMAYAQDGDDATAITYWKNLLGQLDPASGAASSVTQQIGMAQGRIGQTGEMPTVTEPAVTEPTVTEPTVSEPVVAKTEVVEPVKVEPAVVGFGISATITIADELAGKVPGNATLFVFIHPAGAVGMPLAAKRFAASGFPMSLHFTDADLLRPGGSLQDFEKLDISARISMSGIANRAPGDYQATLVTVDTKDIKPIALHLDQRVP